ncbi:MAG: glutamine-hydrolyzing carbamoyl-phosphate synthase small subunit [Verrucomicrobiales bacterium]
MHGLLALEDGRVFRGEAFGASGTSFGEVCFNTSMTGYQEVLTDPSYRGQIVAMTYPLIGNYGTNAEDPESAQPHVRGFVVGELSPVPSNWRSDDSLDTYLQKWNVIGLQGIDTRSLTKHLRTRGAMRAVITTESMSDADAVAAAAQSPGMVGADYVREVTTAEPYVWDPEGTQSCEWTLSGPKPLPPVKHRVVAYDFGIKRNILRRLRQNGFHIDVVNARTSAEDVLARNPDGVFLSNGPGDPAALDYVHREVRKLVGKKPIFAICLGHQMLGHAFGGKTFKLKFGHRGGNQPVKDLRTGKVSITSQNHGFAVDAKSLPPEIEVTHLNLNDNTVEGLSHKEHPVISIQYHPEAAPGPHDASYFFREFARMIEETQM